MLSYMMKYDKYRTSGALSVRKGNHMAHDDYTRPTDAELGILLVLWQRGPCTVREVYEQLSSERPCVYTTILTIMQNMTEKGVLIRDERARAHVYRAAQSEGQAQKRLVGDLLDRVFGGSAQKLVMRALAARKA